MLAGDLRLPDKLRHQDLVPLGTRIRTRLTLQPASVEQLQDALKHLLNAAGNSALMTDQLIFTLCEHALGNFRVLVTTAAELLVAAAQKELSQIDEKLYFERFASTPPPSGTRRPR